ncbi:MAG: hypothetical protein QGH15_07470 [Kiritimatiellia bacterium]|jgi:hypothetical protein|nr:hypothetical protein [Kiritimatiellia bacterium]
MRRWTLLIAACTVGAVALVVGDRNGSEIPTEFRSFTVVRGTVTDVLREVGELTPQDPILLYTPFAGEVNWILEDGTWVSKGERVFSLDEKTLVEQVSTMRANVVAKRQQLRLARLQADQTEIAEQERLETARQTLHLVGLRHRILTARPKRGQRLVELDEQIRPIEERLKTLQEKLEPLEKTYRESRKTYLSALQAWQEGRGTLLELQAKADFARMTTEDTAEKDRIDPEEIKKREKAAKILSDLQEAKDRGKVLQSALTTARVEYDRTRVPYEDAVASIEKIDNEAQELYVEIEIEKLGLPAARLAIDRDIAGLQLAEANRQVESGKRALAAGAISRTQCDQLITTAKAKKDQLEILELQYEIAARPATEDVVAASESTLATAQRAVENAQTVYDREMAIVSNNIAVLEAELEEAIGDLERTGKGFPGAIKGTITMLKSERELLTEAEADRRDEIESELKQLDEELKAAEANPANVVLATTNGLVRLREREGRRTDIGDSWGKRETLAMIYPPENMSVKTGVNEVNLRLLKVGMPCRVRVPALDMEIPDARIEHVARIGRDRDQSHVWDTSSKSGIIVFTLTVDLGRDVDDFRQGMTVQIEIEIERRANVLHLPAAAVQQDAGGFSVLSKKNSENRVPVQGEFFGDDAFVVTGGLKEGDTVYRGYPGVGRDI